MPSLVIRSFDYDADHQRLHVTFASARRYAYHEVPPDLPEAWRAAFAKGVFFNRHVRGRYRATAEGSEAPVR